jgi:hypothetical protein
MSYIYVESRFKMRLLSLTISLLFVPYAYALYPINDAELADSTGEGVALLPEDFSLSMNGADTANSGAGTYGAGYARVIPVGPLSATAEAKGYQKADIYLYGTSLAQSKKNYGAARTSDDWGVPFGAVVAGGGATNATDFGRSITSWGSATNPWLLKTLTDNVPDFTGVLKDVTFITLEAPLYKTGTIAATDSDYNLKLGLWTDLFMRDKTVAESGYSGLSNRLRLAFVWDGFSINGSNLKVFQTLGGVTAAQGGTYNATLKINGVNTVKTFNYGLSTSYNNTLGLAGNVRLNSRPTNAVRGTAAFGDVTRQIIQMNYTPNTNYNTVTQTYGGSYAEGAVLASNIVSSPGGVAGVGTVTAATANGTNTSAGITESYRPMTNSSLRGPVVTPVYKPSHPGDFYDGGICTSVTAGNSSGNNQFGQCLTNEGFTTRRFKASATNSWTPPTPTSVIRLSTQGLSGVADDGVSTPALGGAMPNLKPNTNADGVFLYDANINLVLGSLYQPLMLSTDGNNFSFELARIPNVAEVYRRIYTRYPGDTGDGGVTYLGSTCNIYQCGTSSIAGYQGASATHSSITIGSTTYDNTTNQLQADKTIGAYGVSIGELKAGTGLTSALSQDYVQVWTRSRGTTTQSCGWLCTEDIWAAWPTTWNKVNPKVAYTSPVHPSLNRPNPYETTMRPNYNNQVLGIQTTMPQDGSGAAGSGIANTLNNMTPPGATVSNNFGSAVIDGLLIQHFKLSTTGL